MAAYNSLIFCDVIKLKIFFLSKLIKSYLRFKTVFLLIAFYGWYIISIYIMHEYNLDINCKIKTENHLVFLKCLIAISNNLPYLVTIYLFRKLTFDQKYHCHYIIKINETIILNDYDLLTSNLWVFCCYFYWSDGGRLLIIRL